MLGHHDDALRIGNGLDLDDWRTAAYATKQSGKSRVGGIPASGLNFGARIGSAP